MAEQENKTSLDKIKAMFDVSDDTKVEQEQEQPKKKKYNSRLDIGFLDMTL